MGVICMCKFTAEPSECKNSVCYLQDLGNISVTFWLDILFGNIPDTFGWEVQNRFLHCILPSNLLTSGAKSAQLNSLTFLKAKSPPFRPIASKQGRRKYEVPSAATF